MSQPSQPSDPTAATPTLSAPPFGPGSAEPFSAISGPEPTKPVSYVPPLEEAPPELQKLLFLLVDDSPDGRYLISKTLLRKFPRATIVECRTAETAFAALARETPSLIVTHRTYEFSGIELLRELRQRAPGVLILMTSGIDRREHALEAGADAFYTYEEWLMVGNHVARLLAERAMKKKERST
jgi:CheY-like chemotaxis protein